MEYSGSVQFEVHGGNLKLSDVVVHDVKRSAVHPKNIAIDAKSGLTVTLYFESHDAMVQFVSDLAIQVGEMQAAKACADRIEQIVGGGQLRVQKVS